MCLLNAKASAKVMDNVETTSGCYSPKIKPRCNCISLSFIRWIIWWWGRDDEFVTKG